MARRRRKITDDELLDDESSPRKRRRPRRRWRLLVGVVALAGLVVAAPTIIAKTPLRNLVLSGALPSGVGRLTSTDATFSWSGGQTLAGVVHVDAAGAPLFSADAIAISRSLIGFASNPDNLGKVTLTRPVIHLETRQGGSNLEDFLQRVAEAASQADASTPDGAHRTKTVQMEIIDGVILGRDAATGQPWRIDALAATAAPAGPEAWNILASGALTLASTPPAASQRLAGEAPSDHAGRFRFHLHPALAATGGMNPLARQQLELIADRLPLAPIEPWLARVVPAARLTGNASADLRLIWSTAAMKAPGSAGGRNVEITPTSALSPGRAGGYSGLNLTVNGKLNGSNIRITAAALDGDLVELPTAAIAIDAALIGSRLAARRCTVRSDWLEAELDGALDLNDLAKLSPQSLPTSDVTVTARADLPRLTQMLPRTLRLRPGVRVDAGSLEITARSSKGDAGRRWTVAAALEDLSGTDGVRPIRWTKPMEIGFDAAESPTGPQLQRAILRAAFASASADGAAGGLEGQLQFDLDELADQLGQFVDLSAWKLQGTGEGQFSLRDTGEDRFAASAELTLKHIDVQQDGKVVWQDPELRVEFAANGERKSFKPERVDSATFTMGSPVDALTLELLEPIDLTDFNHSWLLRLTGNGPLDLWAGRLRPWLTGIPEQLAGQSTLNARLRLREGLLHVLESKLSVENFRAQVADVAIVEPQLLAEGDFRWESLARAVESKNLVLTSSTVSARARGLSVRLADVGPPTIRGEVAFRGDFERLSAWGDLFGGATQQGLRPRGQAVGRVQLASDADRATASLMLTAEPFQLVNGQDGALAWNEPRLELGAEGVYAHAEDRLQLSNVRLTGKTVQLNGAGVVEQLRTAGLVRGDMNGSYDAAGLANLLAAKLGPGVQLQGANTARLHATGQLFPAPSPWRGGPGEAVASRVGTSTTPSQIPRHQGEGDRTWNTGPDITAASTRTPPAASLPPHWSRSWQITSEAGWAAANFYGLPVGAARLTANVREGQIHFAPLELAVGQGGRISLQPRVLLDPPPQRLEFAGGQVVSNVAISADVSERMLKYAAPIVAGAARTEGSFSVFMEGTQIPLDDPTKTSAKGRLTIHRLAVTPGLMIQDVANLIRQIEAIGKSTQAAGQGPLGLGLLDALGGAQPAQPIKGITMSERAIDVQVVDGRVYHRNLEFLIDDVPVRSQGSVGFDETLALVIEVPIQAKWVGNKPALKPLIGQVIQIPVHGTFNKPQIDQRAVGNFLAQAAQAAAGGLLGEELNKALDKLLRPK